MRLYSGRGASSLQHAETQTEAMGTSDSEAQTEPVAILDANASGDEFASMIDQFGLRENLQRCGTVCLLGVLQIFPHLCRGARSSSARVGFS
jgi:hypothetical protein